MEVQKGGLILLQVQELNSFAGHEICFGHFCLRRPDMHVRPPLFTPGGEENFSTFSRRDCQFWPLSAHRTADLYVNKIGHDRVLIVCIVTRCNPGSGARSAPAKFLAWTSFLGLDTLVWAWTHFLGLDTLVWASWTRYVRYVIISDGQKLFSS